MQVATRPHLLSRLQDSSFTLTTLIAGRGYGKTSLLVTLSEHPERLLIRLSDADPDPVSIIRLISSALPPQPGTRLDFELARPGVTERAAAAALRHDLHLHQGLTFLLDDAETLNSEGRRFFLTLLPQLGPRHRWIIASPTEDSFPTRALRPHLSTRTLTDEDLALTHEEMQEMGLTDAQMQRTRGWPAAVSLAALGDDPRAVAQDLLLTLPDPLLPALRRASILTTWRESDPSHTGLGLPDGWLTDARTRGLPCTRVTDGAFMPHPIVREELLAQLQARPGEYAAAQRALAHAIEAGHPLAAVTGYLAAGDDARACALLERLLPELRSAEQLAAALPLLRRAAPQQSSPLYVAFAQALFESGSLAEGLMLAEAALQAGADPTTTHTVLGQMRLKTGNHDHAARHFQAALPTSRPPAHDLRARLALTHALHATDLGTLNDDARKHAQAAQAHARAVINAAQTDPHTDAASSTLLAHAAHILALTTQGQWDKARDLARVTRATAATLPPDEHVMTVLCRLARFVADDGDLTTARELLEHAQSLDTARPDTTLDLHLVRARLALRGGNAPDCARHAATAAALARTLHHQPGSREALILLAATAVLPIGDATQARLAALRSAHGHEADITLALTTIEDAFFRPGRARSITRAGLNIPAELKALLAVHALQRSPADAGRLHDLLDTLRQHVGPGTLWAYANLLGITLPGTHALGVPRYTLEIRALRSVPEVFVEGRPLALQPALLLPLLALATRTQLGTEDTTDVYGRDHSPGSVRNHRSALRAVLGEAVGDPNALGRARGHLSLAAWQIKLDIHQLAHAPFHTLSSLYRAPAFSTAPSTSFLDDLRSSARELLAARLTDWAHLDAHNAQATRTHLETIDPPLARYRLAESPVHS
jgi:hypothetical protein